MSAKPVVLRDRADRDIEAVVDYYAQESGADVATGFVEELQNGLHTIAEHPGTGSPRYAQELDLPGLRSRKVARYPQLIFYMEQNDHIDVWRVLHAQRDIPAWLQEGGD